MKDKKINYVQSSIPSGPAAKSITNIGLESKKGGSEFNSPMPKDYVVPDGAKGEKGFSKKSK